MSKAPILVSVIATDTDGEPVDVEVVAQPVTQPRANSRAGKMMVAGWFDKAAVKQLRLIALNHETTMQAQLGRALNLLFRDEGMAALAQIEREDAA